MLRTWRLANDWTAIIDIKCPRIPYRKDSENSTKKTPKSSCRMTFSVPRKKNAETQTVLNSTNKLSECFQKISELAIVVDILIGYSN